MRFYCFMCRRQHESEHCHDVSAARFDALRAAFAKEPAVLAHLRDQKHVRICCAWFAPHTETHGRPSFAAAPPNKSHLLNEKRRRPARAEEVAVAATTESHTSSTSSSTCLCDGDLGFTLFGVLSTVARLKKRNTRSSIGDVEEVERKHVHNTLTSVTRERNALQSDGSMHEHACSRMVVVPTDT